ncbi:MAG TPA: HEAT repeat domain-containing protein [Polyangiaceae bacterium]|jgi:HEAT repeat protein|nr:HEAT repeat domain-containing protein [Polyangiaceae bacterium]
MRVSLATAALGASLALLTPLAASGDQPRPKAGGAADASIPSVPPPIPLPADAIKRLKSGDPAQIKSALDDVRVSGRAGAPAVPAIVDLLKQGLPPSLTQSAIETLGETGNEGASEVLGWYAHQRNVALRRAAVEAMGKTRGALAVKMLRSALSDPDESVRGLSATALGEMKAKEAVGDLFVALDHKVEEAAASIGQLCDPNDCERLAGKLGNVPFDVMTGGLDQVLLRGVKDVDDETKIKIVGRLRELGTAEANQFLKDVQTKWPAKSSPKVKQAIDQAVIATSGSPGSGSGGSQ